LKTPYFALEIDYKGVELFIHQEMRKVFKNSLKNRRFLKKWLISILFYEKIYVFTG
jgi:hypothetical protein